MSVKPTLQLELDQFLYAYAPNLIHKKLMMQIVRKWEDAYQARIDELERAERAKEQMASEGGPLPTRNNKSGPRCDCAVLGQLAPCWYCTNGDPEYDYGHEDMRGTRYETRD